MYSIKPGRSQSLFAAFGLIVFVVVTIGMAVMVSRAGAPGFFVLVPAMMALLGVAGIGLHLYNALASRRKSLYDLTDTEPDPLDGRRPRVRSRSMRGGFEVGGDGGAADGGAMDQFCTHCGARLEPGDRFCGHCGMAVGDE